MSKKNKKRLVTGLACALPVAIAIPSLLTLTQCGSKESTEHIKLSGKTKKEDTKYVFDKKVKYELSLQNINDPLKTQISLPVLKVNGHDIPESQKYLMYTAEVSANGLVTIEFDVEKIKASVSTTNDQEYEVRFNVNLRSEEFNETLADFKLNIITPTFDVITDESTGVNITAEKQCKYGNDYEVTVKPVEYHEIDVDNLKIKIGADEVQDDTDVVKFTKKEKSEVTFKIVGDYIKDKITLIFKGTKIEYSVLMDGCKEGDEAHFTIPGLELAGNKIKNGETVDYYLKWKPDGKTFAKDEAGKPKAYVSYDAAHTQLVEGAIFDEYQLYIPGDKITGNIYLSCEYATVNVKTYLHTTTGVHIDVNPEVPVWKDLEFTYDILEQDEISQVEILVGKKAIPYDPTGKEGYKLSRDTLTSGKLFIPGKFINDEIDITLEQAQKTNYIRKLTGVEGKLVFTPGQEKPYPWSSEDNITLTLDKAVSTEKSYIKRGYKLKNVSATKVILNPLVDPSKRVEEPIESKYLIPTYIDDCKTLADDIKAEAVNGFIIDKAALMSNYSTDVKLSAEVELCKRSVKYIKNQGDKGVNIQPITGENDLDVEHNFQSSINVIPGHKITGMRVYAVDLKRTSRDMLRTEDGQWSFDGTAESGGTLTVNAPYIVGNIEVEIDTQTIDYNVSAHYGQDIEGEANPRAAWTTGSDVKPTYDSKSTFVFTANSHFSYEGVTPVISMEGHDDLTEGTDYTKTATASTMTIEINEHVVCGNITINAVPNPIGYAVDTTSKVDVGVEWKETPATKAYYNQHYVAYFNIKTGYDFSISNFAVKVGGTALTSDTDYTCKWDEQASAWKLDIFQYKVTAPVEIDITPTPVITQSVSITATDKVISQTTPTPAASYINGFTDTFKCATGYVLEKEDSATVSCNYDFTLTDAATGHDHTYTFNIAPGVISPVKEEKSVQINLAPKLEHYGELDTQGFTTSGVTFTAPEAQYHQALEISVTGLKSSQTIDNIVIETGGKTLATGYSITYTVEGATKTAKINIDQNVIEGQVKISGAAETIQCTVNIDGAGEFTFYKQDGTEITTTTVTVDHSSEINWKIAMKTATNYLVQAQVLCQLDGSSAWTDISEHVTFLRNRLTVPAEWVRGDIKIVARAQSTTLIYSSGQCLGFYHATTPVSEIIKEFGGTDHQLEFSAGMSGIADNAFKGKAIPEIYSATIPANCATIGTSAFQNAFTDLNKIVFSAPTSALEIEPYAFDGLANLTIVDFSAYTDITKLTLNANSFANLPSNGQFVVKTGQKTAFQTILTNAGIDLGWTIVEQ